jgi:Flp pilus assembly protein TadG
MHDPVTARAQAVNTLDEVARALKRHHRETRDLIQAVRRAQVTALGITVETAQGPQGGRSDSADNEDRAA